MWKVTVLAATGCIVGGGPVVGLRRHHVALGWEVASTVGPAGVEGGQSIPLGAPGFTGYVAARGLLLLPPGLNLADERPQGTMGATAAVGYAFGEDTSGVMASGAGMYLRLTNNSCQTERGIAWSIELGVRLLGGHAELYAAPKASTMFNLLSCT